MKTLGILAFGALLIVTFGYVTIFGGSSEPTVEPVATDTQPITKEVIDNTEISKRDQFTGSGTIRSLYERGDSLECQITYIPNPLEASITGNMFTADGRVRADFVVPAPDLNGQTVASIIYDQPTLYIWSEIDGETFGVKQTRENFMGLGDTAAAIDYDTQVQYDCLTWPRVDQTIFEPPTKVLFSDVEEMSASMEFGTLFEDENGELPL
jgi:hypothetical protein